jgi:LmbE family N-acetylglucosaminyl deacetylase
MTTVLVVAAHPDDEVLGVGGTVARHTDRGDIVHSLILAEGATSRHERSDPSVAAPELAILADAAAAAAQILGAEAPRLLGLPDNRMDGAVLLDVVKVVEAMIQEVAPSIVYSHSSTDLNVDHRIAHEAVSTACRPLPGACVQEVRFFETPSSTEWRPASDGSAFAPAVFVEVTESLDRKLDALRAYAGEMRPWPHPRSIEAVGHLARWRGATVGVAAAEAFELGRKLERWDTG